MKIGIITLIGKNNFGNRLQNYAVQYYLSNYKKCEVITIRNKRRIISEIYDRLVRMKITIMSIKEKNRYRNFDSFDRRINFSRKIYFKEYNINSLNKFDYLIVGSDQIWNPYFNVLSSFELLVFAEDKKKISFSASFGVDDIPSDMKKNVGEELKKFKVISVRETRGKEIVEELTGRKDIEVLVDPTMLLTRSEWDGLLKKPKMLKCKRYILNCFLGKLSIERKKEIERVAKENKCEIINLLDYDSTFYECGPSEFLYLEKNAFLICTDSFHSCVFAILYKRPFIVFDRIDENMMNMNSRIETLLDKFKLKNRVFDGTINKEKLVCDYSSAYKILEKERVKAKRFIEKAFNTEKFN